MLIDELVTRLGFEVDEQGLRKAESSLKSAMFSATTLGNLAANAIESAFTAGARAIYGIGQQAISSAAEMESLNAEFTVMMGDAAKAAAFTADIRKMAAQTPFETNQLAQNARMLMSMGIAAEKVLPSLSMLGDIAGADAGKLAGLTRAFGQIHSAGKLGGQDLMQLINFGFNPLQIIAEKTGRTMVSLKKDMENGKISVEQVDEAFKSVTSSGGRFYQNMITQSKTFVGLTSTMKDAFALMLGNIGAQILPDAKKILLGLIAIAEGPLTAFGAAVAGMIKPIMTMVMMIGQIGGIIFQVFMGELIPAIQGTTGGISTMGESLALWLDANQEFVRNFITGIVQLGLFLVWMFTIGVGGAIKLVKWFAELGSVLTDLGVTLEVLGYEVVVLITSFAIFKGLGLIVLFQELTIALAAGTIATGALTGANGFLFLAYTLLQTPVTWMMIKTPILTALLWLQKVAMMAVYSGAGGLGRAFSMMAAGIGATLGPLLLIIAAIGALAFAYYQLTKVINENNEAKQRNLETSLSQMEADALLKKATEMQENKTALATLEASGKGASAEALALKEKIAANQRYLDYLKGARANAAKEANAPDLGNFSIPDFKAQLDLATRDAQIAMSKSVTTGGKQTNIKNNIDIAVNADTKDGHTGLSARGVGDAMGEAARAAFSIELQRILVRST